MRVLCGDAWDVCVRDVGEVSGRVGWVFGLGWGDVGRVAGFVVFFCFLSSGQAGGDVDEGREGR